MFSSKSEVCLRILVILFALISCTSTHYVKNTSNLQEEIDQSKEFRNSFTGICVYDIELGQYVIDINADKFFTPASNTKIPSFYAAIELLRDSIPGARYKVVGDSLIFWGTGDPTFLHPDIGNQRVYDFLKNSDKKLFLSKSNFKQNYYGSGWAWDDYSDYYQVEMTPFPIYGNFMRVRADSLLNMSVNPPYASKHFINDSLIDTDDYFFKRDLETNDVRYKLVDIDSLERDIPMKMSDSLLLSLLTDTLNKPVELTDYDDLTGSELIYSVKTDSLLKRMMLPSDNFMAENTLLLVSNTLFDTLNTYRTIRYVRDSVMTFIENKPRWVDGSGLSRYNLFTPRSFVKMYKELYEMCNEETLFELLAIGGKQGTLRNRLRLDEEPYHFVYGKTGTLGNNHNVSGYLKTKSGRTLIFSFMMNHYTNYTSTMRRKMDSILKDFYYHY